MTNSKSCSSSMRAVKNIFLEYCDFLLPPLMPHARAPSCFNLTLPLLFLLLGLLLLLSLPLFFLLLLLVNETLPSLLQLGLALVEVLPPFVLERRRRPDVLLNTLDAAGSSNAFTSGSSRFALSKGRWDEVRRQGRWKRFALLSQVAQVAAQDELFST